MTMQNFKDILQRFYLYWSITIKIVGYLGKCFYLLFQCFYNPSPISVMKIFDKINIS